ncbi:MAG: hypothetical protein DCC75_00870 [Proteobacteria bacterium]|nr:MAG: hypothetical protein DCC75_00870 [Pseudomonadota bacterium]
MTSLSPDPAGLGHTHIAKRQSAFSLFISDSSTNYGLPGRERGYQHESRGPKVVSLPTLSEKEEKQIWNILHCPAATRAEILERQTVITTLLKEGRLLELRHEQLKPIYDLRQYLDFLFDVEESEGFRARAEGRSPRTRLEIMIKAGFQGEDVLNEIRNPSVIASAKSLGLVDLDATIESISALEKLPLQISMAHQLIEGLRHPFFAEWAREAEPLLIQVKGVSCSQIIHWVQGRDSEKIREYKERVGELEEKTSQVGALIAYARLVQRDSMALASFDANEPAYAVNSWNFLREKGGSGRDGAYPQVLNDLPIGSCLNILCGSNMGGKSFFLRQMLYFQLCAQAFGYVPAERANCSIFDSFIFLERGSLHPKKGLSAFGSEIEHWIAALPCLGDRSFVLVDETPSSTDVISEFRLLSALSRYLNSRGAVSTFTSHNERFIEWCGESPQARIFHFGTDLDSNGTVSFSHRLSPGPDPANSIRVAETLGLPASIIQRAQVFLDGGKEPAPLILPALKPADSKSDRHSSKVAQSFRAFIPKTDELVVARASYEGVKPEWCLFWRKEDGYGEIPRVHFYGQSENSPSDHFRYHGEIDQFVTWAFSASDEFDNVPVPRNIYPRNEVALGTFAQALFLYGSSDSRVEIENRAAFLAALHASKADLRILELSEEIHRLSWFQGHIHTTAWDGFNIRLLDSAMADSSKELRFSLMDDPVCTVEVHLSLLKLNIDLCELAGERSEFEAMGARARKLAELYSEQKRLLEITTEKEPQQLDRKLAQNIEQALVTSGLNISSQEFCFSGAIAEVLCSYYQGLRLKLRPVSFLEIESERRSRLFDQLRSSLPILFDKLLWSVPDFLKEADQFAALSSTIPLRHEICNILMATNTPQGAALAKYFSMIFEVYFGRLARGTDLLEVLVNEGLDSRTALELKSRASEAHRARLYYEMQRLCALAKIAASYGANDLKRARILGEPGVSIGAARSFARFERPQVCNGVTLGKQLRAEIVSGPNMSGKSIYLKQIFWSINIGQATGLSPGDQVSNYPFKRILYLDRPDYHHDLNLSSFGHDVQAQRQLLEAVDKADGPCLIFIDEAWSSAPDRYQAALSYAVCAELLERGHLLVVASHCHVFVEALLKATKGMTRAVHLDVKCDPSGGIDLTYKKAEGHAQSLGVDIAAYLGMPKEVLKLVESVDDASI